MPKVEQFARFQFLNDKIDQNTNFDKAIYNYSAFDCSYFTVRFSLKRKSERIEKKIKKQNPNLKRQRCWLTLRLEKCPCCTENRKIGENVSNNNTVKK